MQSAFDETAFRAKFLQLDTENEGKLNANQIGQLIAAFDMEQHHSSIAKTVGKFFYYSDRNNMAVSKLNTAKSIEYEQDEQEQEKVQEERDMSMEEINYKLNIDEALMYVRLLKTPIEFQIWKKACTILEFQAYITNKSKRNFFPLKDPSQQGKVNIVIGKQQEKYISHVHFELSKLESKPTDSVYIELKITTESQEISNRIGKCWSSVYEMITDSLAEEMPDLKEFIKSIKITTQQTKENFILIIQSLNERLNEFLKIISNLGDIIFKTSLKFKIEAFLDFNFDIGEIITNKKANFYEFLSQNIRIRVNYKGSEYITALKELMIAHKSFQGLAYVTDDPDSLFLIALVNIQNADINLRFKNDFFEMKDQNILIELLTMLEESKQMLKQYEQRMPDVIELLKLVLKNKIELKLKAYDFSCTASLNIPNADQLLFKRSVLLDEEQPNERNQIDSSQGD